MPLQRQARRKPTLFWVMVLAFTLAIVLGVCGMLGFFGLALAGVVPSGRDRQSYEQVPRAMAAWLGDYYASRGSWEGIDGRLDTLPGFTPAGWLDFALADERGVVVASSHGSEALGLELDELQLERGLPVEARGEVVGRLVLRPLLPPPRPEAPRPPGFGDGPPPQAASFLRAFGLAGLGLVLVLVSLSVIFSRRISRPLQAITGAARELAGGRLDVQVRGAAVRELDELAAAFNAMARSLADADRQRRQLTADVAHELRTPLTIVRGRLEGLQDGVYEASPEQIAGLIGEVQLLERLVEDLRLLALADAGELPLYREAADPGELLTSAASSFAAEAATQQVALRVRAAPDLPQVDVDPQRIAQVLANLVGNALRYTPPGGSVTLSAGYEAAGRGGPEVVLRVADSGVGIAPDELPHIFDRFWRGDRSRARASGGSGLGLAIARQIVVAHGGTIAAASAPGQGTTITIALPPADPADVPAAGP